LSVDALRTCVLVCFQYTRREAVMEELDKLREELVEARAQAERLAEELADREARTHEMATGMESLRRELEAARLESTQVRDAAREESRLLTERYRAALLQSAPELPPELVHGESADDLDRSLTTAREIMARAREQVQAQAAAHIPAGSPVRGAPDIESLSPTEKIRLGIAERRDE
jgi:septal ring factor EnvC (AmiA/AmiB activator)